MSDRPRIAVVGQGLGGSTAAILLQRAGYDVTVYEQAPALERLGAGINLGPNHMKIMRHIGVADRMYQIGITATRALSREWDTGRILFDRPIKKWTEQYGMAPLTMHRGDLQAVLFSALKPGSVSLGKRLVGIESKSTGEKLIFQDGSSAEADIVIGADGVNSKVREILLGPEPPIYTGVVAYRAIFPRKLLGDFSISADLTKWWSDERLPAKEDRHFIIYYLTHARDEVYFVTGSPDPNWDLGISYVDADMAEIKECYAGFHDEVQRVIDACPRAMKWPLFERNPLPLWSEGNIVMLGDACHPMKPHMGQGAGMSMEDAVILLRCIQSRENPSDAFKLYEANRIERTSRVQRESHNNTWMQYPTDPGWIYEYDPINVPLNMTAKRSGKEDAVAAAR